jgi:hypothetical protein
MADPKGHFVVSGELDLVKAEVAELKQGLIGDLKNPGLAAMVRETHQTVKSMKADVEDLKGFKLKAMGLVAGAGLTGGGIGLGLAKLFGVHF